MTYPYLSVGLCVLLGWVRKSRFCHMDLSDLRVYRLFKRVFKVSRQWEELKMTFIHFIQHVRKGLPHLFR